MVYKKRTSIKDVAKLAGVSPATVSRVINDSDYPVRGETRQAVLAAVEKLAFQPNQVARSLVKRSSNLVGIVVHDISSSYFVEIFRGIEEVLADYEFIITIYNTQYDARRQTRVLRLLQANQVQTIVLPGGCLDDPSDAHWAHEYLAHLHQEGCRIMGVMPETIPGLANMDRVDIGNRLAGQVAAEHLFELGHRTIAYLDGPDGLSAAKERLAGYSDTLAKYGVALDPKRILPGDFSFTSGRAAAELFIKQNQGLGGVTALTAANDESALGFIWQMQQLGYTIPDALSVTGIGNTATSKYANPALTTVDLSLHDIGRQIALRIVQQPHGPAPISLDFAKQVRIVRRHSTAAPQQT